MKSYQEILFWKFWSLRVKLITFIAGRDCRISLHKTRWTKSRITSVPNSEQEERIKKICSRKAKA